MFHVSAACRSPGPPRGKERNDRRKYGFDFLSRRNNKVTAGTLAALIPSGRWNKAAVTFPSFGGIKFLVERLRGLRLKALTQITSRH